MCSHHSFSLLSHWSGAGCLDIDCLFVLGYLEPFEWYDQCLLAAPCLHLLPLPNDHFSYFGLFNLAYHLSALQDLTHLVLQVLRATLIGQKEPFDDLPCLPALPLQSEKLSFTYRLGLGKVAIKRNEGTLGGLDVPTETLKSVGV